MKGRCRVEGCSEPVFGVVPMPTKDYDGIEPWKYCRKHFVIYSQLNSRITKVVGRTQIRKKAFSGRNVEGRKGL